MNIKDLQGYFYTRYNEGDNYYKKGCGKNEQKMFCTIDGVGLCHIMYDSYEHICCK